MFLLNYPYIDVYSQEIINPNDLIKIGNAEFSVEGATKIDAKTAKGLHEKGTVFIDSRDEEFFGMGHISDAILLDVLTTLTEESLAEHVAKDQIVVFYCEYAKCYKSALASAKAVAWGYTNVQYFAEGTKAWEEAGYSLVTE